MSRKRIVSIWIVVFSCSICVDSRAQGLDRIFYSTFSPQGWDIYLSLDHGETTRKVAEHPSLDYGAVVSPDSRWIIFTSERSGMAQLYALPIDDLDSDPRPLFVTGSFQDQAAFTSDRDHETIPHPQFPFARQRGGDIYVVGVNGADTRRLTESPRWDGTPYWSEDGNIYFYSQRDGNANIFRMAADGSGQERLFNYEGPAVMPMHLENGDILFTTWHSETEIKPMRWVAESGEVVPFLANLPHIASDMKINAQGVVVYHGGDDISPPESAVATFGFPGDPSTISVVRYCGGSSKAKIHPVSQTRHIQCRCDTRNSSSFRAILLYGCSRALSR